MPAGVLVIAQPHVLCVPFLTPLLIYNELPEGFRFKCLFTPNDTYVPLSFTPHFLVLVVFGT